MPSASDVPAKYDLVLNGQGYKFADTVDQSLPFRVQRADYSFSRTFVERSNTSGGYGDNQQDFWLTFSQNDWSLGEQKRYFRTADPSRYWLGSNVRIDTEGQVSLEQTTATLTFSENINGVATTGGTSVWAAGDTKILEVNDAKTITDRAAHGLGATPKRPAVVSDGLNVYISTTNAGTVGVRKYNTSTHAYSTFSASGADALEYLNNTLYGVRTTSADLVKWDTAGTLTSVYTWKGVDGTVLPFSTVYGLKSYGGKVLALVQGQIGAELWQSDGASATAVVERFGANFIPGNLYVIFGTVYIAGYFIRPDATHRPAIYYYDGTTVGLLWQADTSTSTARPPGLTQFDSKLAFTDDTTSRLMLWDVAAGGASGHAASISSSNLDAGLASAQDFLVFFRVASTTAYFFPDTTRPTSGYVATSLIDFDSSLDKYVKAIKVDFDAATDGNGGSVDIAYQLNTVDSTYTTVQTGATAGTEYTVGQSCRSISVKITLNKGTSTAGPVLKRITVRAVPVLQSFVLAEYIVDLSGKDGKAPIVLRDGTMDPQDGFLKAQNLRTAAMSTTPFSITDRFGTFTGIIEPDGFELVEIRPEEFLARVRVRQV